MTTTEAIKTFRQLPVESQRRLILAIREEEAKCRKKKKKS
jgi:hypothetical protein